MTVNARIPPSEHSGGVAAAKNVHGKRHRFQVPLTRLRVGAGPDA